MSAFIRTKLAPLQPIGISKSGRPIYPIMGGSEAATEGQIAAAVNAPAGSQPAGATTKAAESAEQNDPAADALGDAGKAALAAERKARRDAEKANKDLQDRLAAFENANKTELQKAQDALAAAEKARADAEQKAEQFRRTQYGQEKGLPLVLAKRLTGTTNEELDAEVAELLPLVNPAGPKPNPQQGQPSKKRGSGIEAGTELYKQLNPSTTT